MAHVPKASHRVTLYSVLGLPPLGVCVCVAGGMGFVKKNEGRLILLSLRPAHHCETQFKLTTVSVDSRTQKDIRRKLISVSENSKYKVN